MNRSFHSFNTPENIRNDRALTPMFPYERHTEWHDPLPAHYRGVAVKHECVVSNDEESVCYTCGRVWRRDMSYALYEDFRIESWKGPIVVPKERVFRDGKWVMVDGLPVETGGQLQRFGGPDAKPESD